MSMSRRDFVRSSATLAAAGISSGGAMAQSASQPIASPGAIPAGPPRATPILISSGNGIPACNKAFQLMGQGSDPMDAVVAGINVVEDDPNDNSVGYGGLPNEDGVVQLDSCVMDGRFHKAGAVASLERVKNPSSVALLVMRRTDHVLIVGEGALKFARAHGFKEQELLTEESRKIWLKWKESHSADDDWLHPEADKEAARWKATPENFTHGTITCMALTPAGDLVGCTSTSGLSYKLSGRVGDSPILGAGLYVDNEVGACGSTGRGEANLQNCSSFLVVELMRGGLTPEQACQETLKRVARHTEKRLRNAKGEPNYGLKLYALRKDGLVGGASLRGKGEMTVHDGKECKHVDIPAIYAEG